MSGLAGLLAGRTPPGAYRWRATYDVVDVQHAVEIADRPFAHVDGAAVETAAQLHAALAEALGFPQWYGANLDALADCLREVRDDTVLLWDAWSGLARAEPRTFAVALDLLGGRLTVLLRGDGPDPGLALLD